MKLRILPYGPSNSVRDLLSTFRTEFQLPAKRLNINGDSSFCGKAGDVIINWGNSRFDQEGVFGNASVLNNPDAIRKASMKTEFFEVMKEKGVQTVEWTTSHEEAQDWFLGDSVVYSRTVLQGHSGAGIAVCSTSLGDVVGRFNVHRELVPAPLYTKGIEGRRREFRIHVMKGTVINVQQKRRSNGWEGNPNYSNVVRNYYTGWIYANQEVAPNEAALSNAVKAVEALGLDFGAVDVITNQDNAWVLEVNTAPGLQGSNLSCYAENFYRYITRQPIKGV